MRRIIVISLLTIFLITSCAQNPAPLTAPTVAPTPFPDSLYVDPNLSLGGISPLVYGSNYGPWIALSLDALEPAYNSVLIALAQAQILVKEMNSGCRNF